VKTLWLIVAVTLAMAAAVFVWRGNFDAAFVAAVLGIVAWFLNYRVHAKAAIAPIDTEEEDDLRNHEIALKSLGSGVKDSDDVE
jgi:hypothetical protein